MGLARGFSIEQRSAAEIQRERRLAGSGLGSHELQLQRDGHGTDECWRRGRQWGGLRDGGLLRGGGLCGCGAPRFKHPFPNIHQ